jgi:hypothetical protein
LTITVYFWSLPKILISNSQKKTLEAFFEDIKQENFKINVRLVKEIVQDKNEIVVTFDNDEQRRTKI